MFVLNRNKASSKKQDYFCLSFSLSALSPDSAMMTHCWSRAKDVGKISFAWSHLRN